MTQSMKRWVFAGAVAMLVLSIFSGVALADNSDRSNEVPDDYVLSTERMSYNNADSIYEYKLVESRDLKSTSVSYTIYATREGLVGHTTANGHVIQDHDHFVALPSTKALCSKDGHEYEVRLTYNGKTVTAPVWDVGPWNTKDDYWNPSSEREMWKDLPRGKPEAQAAYQDGYNDGKDQFGRMVANPAGIDLADGTFWDDLGMTDNDWVNVEFLWVTDSSTKDLPVSYIHQCWDTPNDFDGRHACGATSAVMILSYYNKLDPWPCDCSFPHEHVSNYGNYICKQYTYDSYTFDTMTRDASNNPAYGAYGYIHHNAGDPTDHRAWAWRMVDYFKKHGISDSLYKPTPSESDVKAEIDAGYPVIASTGLVGGHIVVIKGYTDDGYYIVNDPYGKAASGNYDGANVLYTWDYMGVGSRYIVTAHETPPISLDLIFAIDTTGSMWDDIDNVKASASAIVDDVLSDIPGARIAVVDYRDFPVDPYGDPGDYEFNDVLSFSTDKPTIVAAIQGLNVDGGNDWRESVYSALMHSIDSTSLGSWRGSDQAAKVIILMGDAPPHDPEPFTGYTLSSVSLAAELADPVIIYPVQIGGTVEKFEELANQTGGEAFTAENAGEVVDAILDAIEEIKTKPIAYANGPYLGYVGCPITFDGAGSYDIDGTIVSYEWDLDDDGEFDDATEATPSKTWDTAYSGNIGLKVTDNDGNEDVDSTTVTVKDPVAIETATGTGTAYFVADAGTIEDLTALNESDLPEENPGADFPHGLFSFNITGLSNGATVNVTINFPQDIPTTAQYWKYNTSSGEWYQIPIGSNDGDNIITITLQDGGIGDNDGVENGIISDPGAPGVPSAQPTASSTSATGARRDTYRVDENVYTTGSGFTPSTNVDIHVVPDQDWNDGDPIPADVTGAVETVSVNNGDVGPVLVWHAPLTPGSYDIVIDANRNGVYEAATDGLDSGSPGFIVLANPPSTPPTDVPVLTPHGIIALVGLLCVIGVSRIRRRFN